MDWVEVPFTRVVVAVHCFWLALTGDKYLFDRYGMLDHPDGDDRWLTSYRNHKRLEVLEAAYSRDNDGLVRVLAEQRLIQVQALRREVTTMRESLEQKNRALDAMHYVWCTGGCARGQHRYCDAEADGTLTRDAVTEAVRNALRLVTRWNNVEYRRAGDGHHPIRVEDIK
ncbi:MAG: hypothetical protein EBT79_07570 [Actinobacteria bacterium]|nr:hypothetical protein [Actinomycetota bacterium]